MVMMKDFAVVLQTDNGIMGSKQQNLKKTVHTHIEGMTYPVSSICCSLDLVFSRLFDEEEFFPLSLLSLLHTSFQSSHFLRHRLRPTADKDRSERVPLQDIPQNQRQNCRDQNRRGRATTREGPVSVGMWRSTPDVCLPSVAQPLAVAPLPRNRCQRLATLADHGRGCQNSSVFFPRIAGPGRSPPADPKRQR